MAGEDVLYQPGISFTNAKLVKIAAPVRSNPWFYEEKGVGPLSASSKLRRWDGTTQLNRYTPVWNRMAKQRNMEKLGGHYNAMPSMQELGAAPAATSESTLSRDPFSGFLTSFISVVGQGASGVLDVATQQSVQKQQVAQAQTQSYMARFMRPFGGSGDNSWLWILGGVGVLGVGAYFFLKKR